MCEGEARKDCIYTRAPAHIKLYYYVLYTNRGKRASNVTFNSAHNRHYIHYNMCKRTSSALVESQTMVFNISIFFFSHVLRILFL